MSNPKIHCLNVKQGDCFIIERSSGRVTVIDICCGNLEPEKSLSKLFEISQKIPGDYGMRDKPTNPISYLSSQGISDIWRFILTHPDMDHMDGIERLFLEKRVINFWDCGIRRDTPDFEKDFNFRKEDWDFYEKLVDGKISDVNIVTPRAGSRGKYWNADDDKGEGQGDYLSIISPNEELIASATESGDTNDASYVIIYRSSAGRFIFSGDSNDKTWEYILKNHKDLVSDAAVLFAPHHGRKSDRDYTFLDIVKPRISFFGCAPSEHLAYSAWQYRKLPYFTNNQCGNIHIYSVDKKAEVFIENEVFARDFTSGKTFQKDGHWFLCSA